MKLLDNLKDVKKLKDLKIMLDELEKWRYNESKLKVIEEPKGFYNKIILF